MKILEVKRHLNKLDESYLCDLLMRDNTHFMVLKYVNERAGWVGGVSFEAGSITYAYYKTGQDFVLWKMLDPNHNLKGYLFHICRDVKLEEDRVAYMDMLLDVWIDDEGSVNILDRDEVEDCVADGIIGNEEVTWISRQERNIIQNWRQIIADFESLLLDGRN
jgi:protein associated with RNAse G/E